MFDKIKQKIINERYNNVYLNSVNIAACVTNRDTFGPLKNINQGKDVAICGAGPSLNEYKVIANTVHIALNRALLKKEILYDWFFAEDWEGISFMQEEIINYDCLKFLGRHVTGEPFRQIPESFIIKANAKRFYTDSYMVRSGYDSRFVCDVDKMAIGNMPNLALTILPVVLFTNPKKIYLVGCDASQGHFVQPDKLSSSEIDRRETDLKMAVSSKNQNVLQKWKEFKGFVNIFYPDTEIISINPVGLRGLFKDEYQS